ncbi:hypothetical protein ACFL3H_04880 [Gemmatimonadota bacterium]
MSMLAFFPWLQTETKNSLSGFELVPYRTKSLPAGAGTEEQQTIDTIIGSYYETAQRKVTHATILRVGDHGLLDELNEEERVTSFTFSELLTIAGLSNREFFGIGLQYSNTDQYRLFIQSFSGPEKGLSLVSRRRDGTTQDYIPRDAFREVKPHHISSSIGNQVDHDFLEALIAFQNHDQFNRLYESIVQFNLANTDDDRFRNEIEVVLIINAYQRLLNCNSKEHDIANALMEHVLPDRDIGPKERNAIADNAELDKRYTGFLTLREAWIRDLYRLRGQLAHGQLTTRFQTAWSIDEHLLLASYLFPRLLKKLMQDSSHYSLTERDLEDIDLFERLAAVKHFENLVEKEEENEFPWDKVRAEAVMDIVAKKIDAARGEL